MIINLSKYKIEGCLNLNPEIENEIEALLNKKCKKTTVEAEFKEKTARAKALAKIASDANASHAYVVGPLYLSASLKRALKEKGITPLYPPYEDMVRYQQVEA